MRRISEQTQLMRVIISISSSLCLPEYRLQRRRLTMDNLRVSHEPQEEIPSEVEVAAFKLARGQLVKP